MLGPDCIYVIAIILAGMADSANSEKSEDDPLTDERIELPYIIATSIAVLLICCVLIFIFIVLVICVLKQKRRQQCLNSAGQRVYTDLFCNTTNEAMDPKIFGNSIKIVTESDAAGLDVPVEKDDSSTDASTTQHILFADDNSVQHSTDTVKASIETSAPSSCDVTILNTNVDADNDRSKALEDPTMGTEAPNDSTKCDHLKETDESESELSSLADITDDTACQSGEVTTLSSDQHTSCESSQKDTSKPVVTSTTSTDGSLPFLNDNSCHVTESSAVNLSPPNSRALDLVAIYIPFDDDDDDDVPTIVEDQHNSDTMQFANRPPLKDIAAKVHCAQVVNDIKEVNNSQLQSRITQESQVTVTSKETVEEHSLSDNASSPPVENSDIPIKGPSPVICNEDDAKELPHPAHQKISPQKLCSVFINIPCDGSGDMPTLAKSTDTHDTIKEPSPVICNEEDAKEAPNPAHQKISPQKLCSVFINIPCDGSGDMPTLAESTDTHDDQYVDTGCDDDVVELQRNPAYVPVDDSRITSTTDEVVRLQRNPAYVSVDDSCITTSADQTVKLQRNPAYTPIGHMLSEVYLHADDTPIRMEKNPAYTTVNHLPQEDSTEQMFATILHRPPRAAICSPSS